MMACGRTVALNCVTTHEPRRSRISHARDRRGLLSRRENIINFKPVANRIFKFLGRILDPQSPAASDAAPDVKAVTASVADYVDKRLAQVLTIHLRDHHADRVVDALGRKRCTIGYAAAKREPITISDAKLRRIAHYIAHYNACKRCTGKPRSAFGVTDRIAEILNEPD